MRFEIREIDMRRAVIKKNYFVLAMIDEAFCCYRVPANVNCA